MTNLVLDWSNRFIPKFILPLFVLALRLVEFALRDADRVLNPLARVVRRRLKALGEGARRLRRHDFDGGGVRRGERVQLAKIRLLDLGCRENELLEGLHEADAVRGQGRDDDVLPRREE